MFVNKQIAIVRYETCKACDKFTALKTCSECGCFMPAKVKFTSSTCPLNKWPHAGSPGTDQDYSVE